jgi:4-carboxymuconolactone decarboxylase
MNATFNTNSNKELHYLVHSSVLAAQNRMDECRLMLEQALADNIPFEPLYEALLQIYLFAGFPAALEGLACLAGVYGMQAAERSTEYDPILFREKGTITCQAVYGGVFQKMMEKLSKITPDLSDWMIVEGYGKTLSRKGLSLAYREVCNACVLTALGWKNQANSHIRGSLLNGISPQLLRDMLLSLSSLIPAPSLSNSMIFLENLEAGLS